MSSNSNSEDVESREEECNGEHVVTTAGKLLKLTCSWKPIFFPFRKYVLWDKQPPMASQSKLLVSDDHKYALRMRLNWVTKRFELIVSQEPFPSLYKLKVIFKCEEDTWLEKTDFLPSSKAFFSWVPEYRKTFGYLNIHSSVKIICGIAKQQKIDLVFNEHVKMMIAGMKHLFELSTSNHFAMSCDFVFKTEDNFLMAHKAIVGSASPKLAEVMFRSNAVTLAGVSFDGLSAFIRCIYTGEYDVPRRLIPDVLVLSRRYQVKWMATHFRDLLINGILRMCAKLNSSSRNPVLSFCQCRREVLQSQSWRKLSEKHPECVAYILVDALLMDESVSRQSGCLVLFSEKN